MGVVETVLTKAVEPAAKSPGVTPKKSRESMKERIQITIIREQEQGKKLRNGARKFWMKYLGGSFILSMLQGRHITKASEQLVGATK